MTEFVTVTSKVTGMQGTGPKCRHQRQRSGSFNNEIKRCNVYRDDGAGKGQVQRKRKQCKISKQIQRSKKTMIQNTEKYTLGIAGMLHSMDKNELALRQENIQTKHTGVGGD